MLVLSLLFGIWRGIFSLAEQELPITFELQQQASGTVLILHNATERILCTELREEGDSVFIRLPMYDSEFRLKNDKNTLSGIWINYLKKGAPSIPFTAVYANTERFTATKKPSFNLNGKWETHFDAGTKDSSLTIGQFQQNGNKVTGTFLTESGDHRYLEGVIDGDSLKLSVFDGFFCRLYLARFNGNRLEGKFYSGSNYKSDFYAFRNDTVKLRDPATLSSFEGKPSFSLPDVDSNLIALSDERFKNKVVILQIMGSWCPNCMDESEFLSGYYNINKTKGVEIIGLSFERTADFRKVSQYLKRIADRFKINYPLLFAGTTGSGAVEKALPGMKNFFSYPTTVYIGKDGMVKYVHAGFNGPATGEAFEVYKKEFYERMHQLLAD